MSNERLTISGLRKILDAMEAEHGDLPCVIDDADTGWAWVMKHHHISVSCGRLRIGGDYADEEDDRPTVGKGE